MRVFVLYGQGGALTSFGMIGLANRIKALGANVTRHNWDDYTSVADEIRKTDGPVAIVGFSLGANATTWISNAVKRSIDLIVAYDPSIWSTIRYAGPNVKRLLLYHNAQPDLWGNARIPGAHVETTTVHTFHLAVQFDGNLHQKTITAIREVQANG